MAKEVMAAITASEWYHEHRERGDDPRDSELDAAEAGAVAEKVYE